jgi:hypothetical protein
MRRTLRYLRIAVTALSPTACLPLVALWMRSYTWCDIICLRIDGKHDQWLRSLDGKITYDGTYLLVQDKLFRWIVHPAADWRESEQFRTKAIIQWFRGDRRLLIPHWFPTVIFAALMLLPWLHWRRWCKNRQAP